MSTSPHANRPLHHRALAIISAPLAHAHHRRYRGVPHHLAIDTALNFVIYALLAAAIVLSVVKVVGAGPTIRWDLPEVVSGKEIEALLTVVGAASGTMQDLVVTPKFPPSWIVTDESVWNIGDLRAGESRTRTYRVQVNGAVNHPASLQTTSAWTTFRLRIQSSDVMKVTSVGSVFDFELTTAPTTDGTGTTTMRVVQRSGRPLDGIRVALIIPAQTTVTNDDEDFDGVIWTPGSVPTDQAVEKIVSWTTTAGRSTRLQFYATLSYQTVGEPITMVERSIETIVQRQSVEPDEENLGTRPTIAAEARYQSATGITFGFGPNPPRVGQQTVYRLFWYVRPGSREAAEGTVSAVLPSGVSWYGRESLTGGQGMSYDAKTRRITWRIGALRSDQGPMMASFDLSIKPVTKDRGRTASLLGLTSFTTRIGSQTVTATAALLTTANIDGGGTGTGIVR